MATDQSQESAHKDKADHTGARAKPQLRGTTLWILISIVTTGLLVGWLTGLSESPVAGVVLPLILTLIAGAGGFHFASKRPETPNARDALRRTAQATSLFMLSCWLGLHLGILVRTTPTSQPKVPISVSVAEVKGLTSAQAIELAALERRLTLLGASESAVQAFASSYVGESEARGHPGPMSPPTLQDLEQLETAIRDVSHELDNAKGRSSSALVRFKNNTPTFLARIQQLREYIRRTNLAIPSEHYREFLDAIKDSNAELINHREGNKEGSVLTPAPIMNYVPLYVLNLVVDIQKEPIGDESGRLSRSRGYDIEMIDEAIRLSLNIAKPEPAVQSRYSVKR